MTNDLTHPTDAVPLEKVDIYFVVFYRYVAEDKPPIHNAYGVTLKPSPHKENRIQAHICSVTENAPMPSETYSSLNTNSYEEARQQIIALLSPLAGNQEMKCFCDKADPLHGT